MTSKITGLFAIFLTTTLVHAQTTKPDSTYRKCFFESSLLSLANFSDQNPSFYQLNLGYNITSKDAVIIEAWTFKHKSSLGIPYGSSFVDPNENYPGYIRENGVGLSYQRFLWKNLFTTVNITPFFLRYYDSGNKKIQNGFRLFSSLRVGYQFNFFKKWIFLKPSLAINYWPISTNIAESFLPFENKWPNYFLFDPGINVGVKF